MGKDVEIYLKTKDGKAPDLLFNLPNGFELVEVGELDDEIEGATHCISTLVRYYGKGYERGPFHIICAVLMLLHESDDVETVWYGNDDYVSSEPFTKEDTSNLALHFMNNGSKPYKK